MEKQNLEEKLAFLNIEGSVIEIILYGQMNNGDLKMLDIDADDLIQIRTLFLKQLNRVFLEDENYSIVNLSTTDERANCYFEYDLDIPADFSALENVFTLENIENFNFRDNDITDISTLIIAIKYGETQISLYKKIYPLEIIGRSSFLLGRFGHSERFKRFEDKLLRLSPKFQILSIDDVIIVLDLKFIERSLGFADVIKREATLGVDAIEALNILSSIEPLNELISDVSFARKLTKIARNSPVLQNRISNAKIILFAKNHPALKDKIRYNEDGSKIILDTKVSKNLFIKLLNDDYLTSQLTEMEYDSLAKDSIALDDV